MKKLLVLILMMCVSTAYAYRITKPLRVTDYDQRGLVIINDEFERLWDITNGRYNLNVQNDIPTGTATEGDMVAYSNSTTGVYRIYSYLNGAWREFISSFPYASYSDSTTQELTLANTAYSITFNTDEIENLVTHSTTTNTSRIYLDVSGVYLITFSVIGETPTANKHLDIWLAVNGTNVARSNTITEFTTAGNERLITVTYLYQFTAGQYFELKASSDVAKMTLKATAAAGGPTRPACPSIILTVNKIGD